MVATISPPETRVQEGSGVLLLLSSTHQQAHVLSMRIGGMLYCPSVVIIYLRSGSGIFSGNHSGDLKYKIKCAHPSPNRDAATAIPSCS
mmetsp:Transcript_12965/g.23163  ORF Transcript_12965/g.23163 Transcript_12965/m.23163 type:complete len:89 (-) Transcript_12965:93-359(-)